ncbi:MAG: DUF167 domain-containing protein [Burkholderiaceae bacterium]
MSRGASAPLSGDAAVWLSGAPGAWRIRLAVQPGAARSEVVGVHDDCLKLRIAAPPVDGRANDEVLRFVAERLGVPRKRIRLLAGAGARRKLVEAEVELDAAELAACFG